MPEVDEKKIEKLEKALRSVEDERDQLRKTLRDREQKLADQAVQAKRLEREILAAGGSPLDADPKVDVVERVVAALRTRGASDASLRVAHDRLMLQHQAALKDVATLREALEEAGREATRLKAQASGQSAAADRYVEIMQTHGMSSDHATLDLAARWLKDRLAAANRAALENAPSTTHLAVGGGEVHIHLHLA